MARDALSARLDGELAGVEAAALDAHLTTCAGCREHLRLLAGLHRQLRLRPAVPVPDLTAAILAALPDPPGARPGRRRGVRRRPSGLVPALDGWRTVLLVVAATQLALSLPLLVAGEQGATGHVTRELGAFSVAFAAGLLVVVWQPHRAAGLLPVAVALAAALVLGAGADLLSGRTAPLAEGHHLVELVGLGLLRGVARTSGAPGRARLAAA